jgi:hypothetical protein
MQKFEEWNFISKEGYKIEGRTDFAGKNASGKCFVIVHGYCGTMNEHLHEEAMHFFTSQGYDVVRFNLQSQRHKLRDCTLQTHAHYLLSVLEQQCRQYNQIYLSGHSYGGPTIMIAQPQNIAAICLWDPSFNLPALWNQMEVEEHADFCVLNFGGNEVLAGSAMAKEGRNHYQTEECLGLSKSIGCPIKVISASEGEEFEVYKIDKKSWHSSGHHENCRIVIPNSDHNFTRGGSLSVMLNETYDWFEKFS